MRSEIKEYHDMKKKVAILDKDDKAYFGVVGMVDSSSFTLIAAEDVTLTIRYEDVQYVESYDDYMEFIQISND